MIDGFEIHAVAFAPEAPGHEVPRPEPPSRPLQRVGDEAVPAAWLLLDRRAIASFMTASSFVPVQTRSAALFSNERELAAATTTSAGGS